MDELKLVLDIIQSLPDMALWALVVIYFYKVTIVGSIYGVIRYLANKWHDYAVTKKAEQILPPRVHEIHFADILQGITVNGDSTMAQLVRQIQRLQSKKGKDNFIDKNTVAWLRDAIDEKLEKDEKELERVG